jgi:ActR/RegA family two-component response regulator
MNPSEDVSQVQIEHGPKLLALIVDDDDDFRASVAALAAARGLRDALVGSLEQARKTMLETPPDLVLVDLRLPDGHGLELLAEGIPAADTEFVVVTGNASVETADPRDPRRRARLHHQAVRSDCASPACSRTSRARAA